MNLTGLEGHHLQSQAEKVDDIKQGARSVVCKPIFSHYFT